MHMLALDFRPWLAPLARRLTQTYSDGQLSHAVILVGAKHSGKAVFARAFTARLLCDSVDERGGVCGTCKGCALYSAGTHPDFIQLEPPEGKQQITVDSVRSAKEKLLQSAQIHRNKVCLINSADQLNESAANALLKLLEEPPQNTYFLLLSSQYQLLSPTIRSRCTKMVMAIPNRKELASGLQLLFPSRDIENALEASRGFPEIAVAMLTEQDSVEVSSYNAWLLNCLNANGAELEQVKTIASGDLALFLDQFLRVVAIAIRCAAVKPKHDSAAKPDMHSLDSVGEAFARAVPIEQLRVMQQHVITAKARCRFNPNAALLLESLLLDCFRP